MRRDSRQQFRRQEGYNRTVEKRYASAHCDQCEHVQAVVFDGHPATLKEWGTSPEHNRSSQDELQDKKTASHSKFTDAARQQHFTHSEDQQYRGECSP